MANKPDKPKKPGRRIEVNPLPKGGQAATAAGSEDWKKWSQLVAQAWADEKLKQRLLDEPASVLQEHGIAVPAGVEVRVVENTEKVSYLTLPAKPAGEVTELTSSQMRSVSGGACCFSRPCGSPPRDCIILTSGPPEPPIIVVTAAPNCVIRT
jgi:hypothetical protein